MQGAGSGRLALLPFCRCLAWCRIGCLLSRRGSGARAGLFARLGSWARVSLRAHPVIPSSFLFYSYRKCLWTLGVIPTASFCPGGFSPTVVVPEPPLGKTMPGHTNAFRLFPATCLCLTLACCWFQHIPASAFRISRHRTLSTAGQASAAAARGLL